MAILPDQLVDLPGGRGVIEEPALARIPEVKILLIQAGDLVCHDVCVDQRSAGFSFGHQCLLSPVVSHRGPGSEPV